MIEQLMDELGLDWLEVQHEFGVLGELADFTVEEASDLIDDLIDRKREEEYWSYDD